MVPNIDLKTTCGNAATVTGSLTQNDIDGCIADEQEAHKQLAKQWAQYAGIDRDRCVRASSDYVPSYVELLTRLEMAKDAGALPDEQTSQASKQPR